MPTLLLTAAKTDEQIKQEAALLDYIKLQIRPILNQKPHALTRQFMDEVVKLLAIDSLYQMQKGLRSLLKLFTFKHVDQVKQTIYQCLEQIEEYERN